MSPEEIENCRQRLLSNPHQSVSELALKYVGIMVDRRVSPNAFMTTREVTMEVDKQSYYHINLVPQKDSEVYIYKSDPNSSQFNKIDNIVHSTLALDNDTAICKRTRGGRFRTKSGTGTQYLEIGYKWDTDKLFNDEAGNIFGDNSLLEVFANELKIPVNSPTKEHFEDFNSLLLDMNESFNFEVTYFLFHTSLHTPIHYDYNDVILQLDS